ncbi:MAG: tRNA adenosine(34) deaminase TadA [Nitrospirales bacterium]|nr:tRNA adenosine(34) deaminase TadA [Nitrospirales bacterium]
MLRKDPDEKKDQYFMELALQQAKVAATLGDIPVGAVLVHQDNSITLGHNQKEILNDPTAHAEIITIRKAAEQIRTWRLINTTLYVTLEPCCMCIGAIIQARITRLVFGAADPKSGACGSLMNIPHERRLNHHVMVTQGILEQPCGEILTSFFQYRR